MADLPINQRLLIKATPNATFKLLIVMVALGGIDLGNKQLAFNSGLSLPTVQNCLIHLASIGLVTQTKRYQGWQLTQGVQMLLPTSQKVFDSLIKVDSDSININKIVEGSTLTISSQEIFDSKIPYVPEENHGPLARLHLMGVLDPKASILARMPHVTNQYLKDYDLGVAYGTIDLKLAIWKIQRGQNWGFEMPDRCTGCSGEYDWGLKDLDHADDCYIKARLIKRWPPMKGKSDG